MDDAQRRWTRPGTTVLAVALLLLVGSPLAAAGTCTPEDAVCQDGSTVNVGADPWETTGAGDGPVGGLWRTATRTGWSAIPTIQQNLSDDHAPGVWLLVGVAPGRGPDGYTLGIVVRGRVDNETAGAAVDQSTNLSIPARPGEGGVGVGADGSGEGTVDPAWIGYVVRWVDRHGGDAWDDTGMSGTGIFWPAGRVNRILHEELDPFPVGATLGLPSLQVDWSWSADACAGACLATGSGAGHVEHPKPADAASRPTVTSHADTGRHGASGGWEALGDAIAPSPSAAGPDHPVRVGLLLTVAVAAAIWFLYRRLTAEEVLANDLRQRILDLVAEDPGVHASALARRLDVAVTTVLYHVDVLADAGHLTVKRSDGQVTCFPADGAGTILERELVLALRAPGKSDLLEVLREEPGLNISEAARRLDRNRSTVKRHADELVDRGLVATKADGRSRRLALTDEAREAWSGA